MALATPALALAVVLVASPAPPAADTVIPVGRGARLEIESRAGTVTVRSWNRDAVRVVADLPDGRRADVRMSGSVVRLRPSGGTAGSGEMEVTVPRWLDVRIEGNQLDVAVAGTEAGISIETMTGDIRVAGGDGLISARTIGGDIVIRGARGQLEAFSVNEDIRVADVAGPVRVETTNGDIELESVRSEQVRAATVNGDVTYAGTVRDGGRYSLATHNGDLTMTIPQGTNATVAVSTYHGEFESDFPVRLTGASRDRVYDFTLGSGSARIELQSFNGEIRLRRP